MESTIDHEAHSYSGWLSNMLGKVQLLYREGCVELMHVAVQLHGMLSNHMAQESMNHVFRAKWTNTQLVSSGIMNSVSGYTEGQDGTTNALGHSTRSRLTSKGQQQPKLPVAQGTFTQRQNGSPIPHLVSRNSSGTSGWHRPLFQSTTPDTTTVNDAGDKLRPTASWPLPDNLQQQVIQRIAHYLG
uniref:Glutamate decarboxylase n=1 Tax=Lactiplantibacillus plantarum TaxID=1590 RepID=A0A0C6ERF0_LACPN|nr:glutamate decarboxylase [Lactiplantibacillus plantarum]